MIFPFEHLPSNRSEDTWIKNQPRNINFNSRCHCLNSSSELIAILRLASEKTTLKIIFSFPRKLPSYRTCQKPCTAHSFHLAVWPLAVKLRCAVRTLSCSFYLRGNRILNKAHANVFVAHSDSLSLASALRLQQRRKTSRRLKTRNCVQCRWR